eukprot:COSAG01_NODE_1_length_100484_cov_170.446142_23_plen_673_part_00
MKIIDCFNSRRIVLFLRFFVSFFLFFVFARLAFLLSFLQQSKDALWRDIIKAFIVGMQFDCRLVICLFLPLLSLTLVPVLNVTRVLFFKYLSVFYLSLISFALAIIYAVDFGYFAYVNHRIDISIVDLLIDFKTSFNMVLQSYPIVKIGLALVGMSYVFFRLIRWIIKPIDRTRLVLAWWKKVLWVSCFALLFLLGAWQSFGKYALRWDAAFFVNNSFVNALALNPVLFFINTVAFQEKEYDLNKLKKSYANICEYLDMTQNKKEPFFIRKVSVKHKVATPNLVIVLLETFPAQRLKQHGNSYNPAPYLSELADKGIYFQNAFSPMWNTGVAFFSLIASVPDVGRSARSSSRNPYTLNQNSILNSFHGYQKYFFTGGSAGWANIRGFMKQNINGIHIYEEKDFKAKSEDTWGVSDYDMFQEASKILSKSKDKAPFAAVFLTGSNHRPYTIAKNAKAFKVDNAISKKEYEAAGFISKAEYNALRLLDFSVNKFVEQAIKDGYGKNTIFCFVGDHGTVVPKSPHISRRYFDLDLSENHVPFIIYSPGKIIKKPQKVEVIASLSDVLPTLAGIAGISYTNKTLGRDLLNINKSALKHNMVIMAYKKKSKMTIRVIGEDFLLSMLNDGSLLKLYKRHEDTTPLVDVKNDYPSETMHYKHIGQALYQSSSYLLFNPQ